MNEADLTFQQLLLRLQGLSDTPYACSRWAQLSGGTTNLIYRGTLNQPLERHNGAGLRFDNTIVLKHAMTYVPGNKDFCLDITRCEFEEAMLRALGYFSYANATTKTVVKTPRLYLFDRATNTQVLEDLWDTSDLKTVLRSSQPIDSYPGGSSASLGYTLGSWLRSFHAWTSALEQEVVCEVIGRNKGMRDLKHQITYGSFLEILEFYPQIVEGHVETLQAVKDAMAAEFKPDQLPKGDDWGLIHGDFWSGNVLLPNNASQTLNCLFIIDWEYAQLGHRSIDVGGMIADLYERKHFQSVDAATPAMEGFMEGYGQISSNMAFRTAIHVGVHLICWHIRRNPNLPLPAPQDKIISALTLGRDFILKGWGKDIQWFEKSMLAPLFTISGQEGMIGLDQ